MNKKRNSIRPREHGAEVELDPSFLLQHALYMPDGKTIVKSNMTLGQAIEAIAYAHIKAKLPHLLDRCQVASIKFEDGRFQISFTDGIGHEVDFGKSSIQDACSRDVHPLF